jgi:hypothetical protein
VPDISKPDDPSGAAGGAPGTPPTGDWGAPPGAPPAGWGYGQPGGPPPGYGAPGYGPPPGYGPQSYGPQPGYGYGVPPPPPISRPTNGYALASLILGLALVYFCPAIPVTGPLAIVFGHRGKREIEASGGQQDGDGLATAGIVLGWIGTGIAALAVLVVVIAIVAAAGSDSDSLGALAALAA